MDIGYYRLQYTIRRNKKILRLIIPKKALSILGAYKHLKEKINNYVFPGLRGCPPADLKCLRLRINTSVKKFNMHLYKLAMELEMTKKISMHIASHTFGNISGYKIPIQMLQRLYRHSSIITTINYQGNFTHKASDDALESVIDF